MKKPHKKPGSAAAGTIEATRFSPTGFLERHATAVVVAFILLASARISLTYTVFNHTSDEPNHIACGLEWLQRGTYTFETQHPPLSRVAVALGPYLIGARVQGAIRPDSLDVPLEGARMLSRAHRYDLTLALARLGNLPFFWFACLVVYWWARRYHGAVVGIATLALFSFIPPVLAHAGLATTDMALTAFAGASFVAALWWIEQPSWRRGAAFGACCGLALISKFSILPFLPACLGCALLMYVAFERPAMRTLLAGARRALPSFGVAILAGALVTWAGFRFSFGKYAGIPLPAPELFSGIHSAVAHNRFGHHTYLLGQYSVKGFWYYYPVVLAVKTPLALLLLVGCGLILAIRKQNRPAHIWQPLGLIAGVMAVGFYSRINIGVRHILPIYMGMALMAAIAAARLPQLFPARRWGRVVPGALLLWFAGSSLLAHPDYLAYFNELAGSDPEKIVVDSDLDWGQDLKRLAQRLQEAGAASVAFHSTVIASLGDLGFPPVTRQDPFVPSSGWNAVSMTYWKLTRMGLVLVTRDGKLTNYYSDRKLWPDEVPRGERVGKSILLWNVSLTNQPSAEKHFPLR